MRRRSRRFSCSSSVGCSGYLAGLRRCRCPRVGVCWVRPASISAWTWSQMLARWCLFPRQPRSPGCASRSAQSPRSAASTLRRFSPLPHTVNSASHGRLRRSLLVVQMAFTVVLVACSAWFSATVEELRAAPRGWDSDDIVAVRLAPLPGRYDGSFESSLHYRQLLERIAALPGVQTAALSNTAPPVPAPFRESVAPADRTDSRRDTLDVSGQRRILRHAAPSAHGRIGLRQIGSALWGTHRHCLVSSGASAVRRRASPWGNTSRCGTRISGSGDADRRCGG